MMMSVVMSFSALKLTLFVQADSQELFGISLAYGFSLTVDKDEFCS